MLPIKNFKQYPEMYNVRITHGQRIDQGKQETNVPLVTLLWVFKRMPISNIITSIITSNQTWSDYLTYMVTQVHLQFHLSFGSHWSLFCDVGFRAHHLLAHLFDRFLNFYCTFYLYIKHLLLYVYPTREKSFGIIQSLNFYLLLLSLLLQNDLFRARLV